MVNIRRTLGVAAAAAAVAIGVMTSMLASSPTGAPTPIIIGHRGIAGRRPEHTIEGYRLAAESGADFIEPDLVPTKDGVLIARHENEIGGTTDVAARFPDRQRTKTIDGMSITGWFSEDFTLAEIKTLRAKERLPFRSHEYDGRYLVPTFGEVIELAQRLEKELGRPIGVYPETKHPTYFRSSGLPLEATLLNALASHGWNRRDAPVFIQSFEASSLREMRRSSPVKMIQLLDEGDGPVGDSRLREISTYADGIGANSRLVIPAGRDRRLLEPTDLIARAHAAGLLVHIWTLRDEPTFLSPTYNGDPAAEYRQFRMLGVDGIFTDFADTARGALR
jgi:glycerophosphoryl diester phosphodiesterase